MFAKRLLSLMLFTIALRYSYEAASSETVDDRHAWILLVSTLIARCHYNSSQNLNWNESRLLIKWIRYHSCVNINEGVGISWRRMTWSTYVESKSLVGDSVIETPVRNTSHVEWEGCHSDGEFNPSMGFLFNFSFFFRRKCLISGYRKWITCSFSVGWLTTSFLPALFSWPIKMALRPARVAFNTCYTLHRSSMTTHSTQLLGIFLYAGFHLYFNKNHYGSDHYYGSFWRLQLHLALGIHGISWRDLSWWLTKWRLRSIN